MGTRAFYLTRLTKRGSSSALNGVGFDDNCDMQAATNRGIPVAGGRSKPAGWWGMGLGLPADRPLQLKARVNLHQEHPNLSMALEIIQTAKSLGLATLPEATLKRLAGLMNQLPPQHKLCVFHGLANLFDKQARWKS